MINYLGILFAIIACACWGLSMICPVFAPEFTAVEITLGRYFFYGVVCLGLWLRSRRSHSWTVWKMALVFALTGNLVYYGLEVVGVKMIGPSMVALLFAINPICVCLYGNLKNKEIPFSLIVLPIILVLTGILVVHVNDIQIDPDISQSQFLIGMGFTISSIAMWAWYAVHNARYLKNQTDLNPADFNMIIGLWCLILSLMSMAIVNFLPVESMYLLSPEITNQQLIWFLIATATLGLFGSYFGTFFWLRASKMLPLTLAGQIIVAETCSGLIYTYLNQQRFPRWYELVGFVLVIGGVLISIRKVQQYQAQLANA